VGALASEPVAALGVVAPASLQGLNPTVSLALAAALAEVSPPIGAIPTFETVNRLTDQGLAAEYAICSRASLTTGSWTVGGCTGSDPDLARVRSCSRRNRSQDGGGGDRWAGRRSASSRASVGGSCALFDDRDTGRIEHRKAVQQNVKQRRVTDPDGARLREAELRCREFRC